MINDPDEGFNFWRMEADAHPVEFDEEGIAIPQAPVAEPSASLVQLPLDDDYGDGL